MSDKILIMSRSGQGKSTSLRTLNPDETVIINVAGKPLPFKGWKAKYSKEKKNLYNVYEADKIAKYLKLISENKPNVKNIVIDDAQYIMAYEFMRRAKERGFDKFTEIAAGMFEVIITADELRDDITVIFLTHTEDVSANGFTLTKMKTIGKMLDDKVTIEGMFTVVLMADIQKKGDELEYVFNTASDGTTTVKAPMDMFPSKTIPNDMQAVLNAIKTYNEGE